MSIAVWPHYQVFSLQEVAREKGKTPRDFVLDFFKEPTDWELNWLFVGTSGVHGSYDSLDDIEDEYEFVDGVWRRDGEEEVPEVTVLIVQPRLCVLYYGNIEIKDPSDVQELRSFVWSTIRGILSLQLRSLPTEAAGLVEAVLPSKEAKNVQNH